MERHSLLGWRKDWQDGFSALLGNFRTDRVRLLGSAAAASQVSVSSGAWFPSIISKKPTRWPEFTFGVLGAFYGLVLAFVIVAAWEQFTAANANSHQEASALESLYKLGAGFAESKRVRIGSAKPAPNL